MQITGNEYSYDNLWILWFYLTPSIFCKNFYPNELFVKYRLN